MVVGSPTTDLLGSVDCLLRDCERYFPNADRKMAQKLIVRLQVTIDSVRGLLDSLDRGEAGNTARILVNWHWIMGVKLGNANGEDGTIPTVGDCQDQMYPGLKYTSKINLK